MLRQKKRKISPNTKRVVYFEDGVLDDEALGWKPGVIKKKALQ